MHPLTTASGQHRFALLAVSTLGAVLAPRPTSAQGCMPIRFISPVVGGHGDVYLKRHTWQASVAYRRLTSNQFVVGQDVRNELGPGGQSSIVNTNAVTASVAYAVSNRLSFSLNIPFSQASTSRIYADNKSHEVSASGLGDLNLIATYWLRNGGLEPRGNLAFGLGVKAPTGSNHAEDNFWNKNGSIIRFPVDQSIQPGDGGWGVILQVQGFQPVLHRSYVYAAGSYTSNPGKVTDVVRSPGSTQLWGIPDTYNARVGVAMTIGGGQGVSVSLGGRLDGTTKRDLIGGGAHLGFRRPAVVGYVDPGLSVTRGSRSFALSVPVRAYKNFRASYVDLATGKLGGGGLARYQILASFSQRFGGRGLVRAGGPPPR